MNKIIKTVFSIFLIFIALAFGAGLMYYFRDYLGEGGSRIAALEKQVSDLKAERDRVKQDCSKVEEIPEETEKGIISENDYIFYLEVPLRETEDIQDDFNLSFKSCNEIPKSLAYKIFWDMVAKNFGEIDYRCTDLMGAPISKASLNNFDLSCKKIDIDGDSIHEFLIIPESICNGGMFGQIVLNRDTTYYIYKEEKLGNRIQWYSISELWARNGAIDSFHIQENKTGGYYDVSIDSSYRYQEAAETFSNALWRWSVEEKRYMPEG